MKVSLEKLTRRFSGTNVASGPVAAVNGIDLTIEDGEFFVLLGPSGCGKSTILNLLAGLDKPTGGRLRFGDQIVASAEDRIFIPPGGRNIAMVFQSYALYPHMTVFENIAFPLRVAHDKSRNIPDAVREAARMLDILNMLDRKPAELSGGQRQRVAIARAVVRRPSVFLLDEPLSNLDAQLRTSTRAELKRLQAELGVTTVYVTHDQTEAMTLGQRVALLREGSIVQVAQPEQLYAKPATLFAATFIGSPPMNLLNGHIEQGKLDLAGTRFDLPDSADSGSISGDVQVGIRPESILLRGTSESNDGRVGIRGDVVAVEPLGREVQYHIAAGGRTLIGMDPERRFGVGNPVIAAFDADAIHLFDSRGNRVSTK